MPRGGAQEKSEGAHQKTFGRRFAPALCPAPPLANCFRRHCLGRETIITVIGDLRWFAVDLRWSAVFRQTGAGAAPTFVVTTDKRPLSHPCWKYSLGTFWQSLQPRCAHKRVWMLYCIRCRTGSNHPITWSRPQLLLPEGTKLVTCKSDVVPVCTATWARR